MVCFERTFVLNNSKCRNLLILTARSHNLLRNIIFQAYLCVNDKQTKEQPTEVFMC